jgi:hypothetical protein
MPARELIVKVDPETVLRAVRPLIGAVEDVVATARVVAAGGDVTLLPPAATAGLFATDHVAVRRRDLHALAEACERFSAVAAVVTEPEPDDVDEPELRAQQTRDALSATRIGRPDGDTIERA